jgi:hypothetical protein
MEIFQPRSIYDLLDGIRLRPGLYIGFESLAKLSGFLSGFELACDANRVELVQTTPSFGGFLPWLESELRVERSSAGWVDLIAEKVGEDGLEAMHEFFELLDRYRRSSLVTAVRKDLSPPRRRLDLDEDVRRIEVVERENDGAWFVWLTASGGTCACRRMGYGRESLVAFLDSAVGPGIVDEA